MPIVVDKEERRELVVSIAFELVAAEGIEALTFRQIAAATGYSTSIVSHYFRNKNDLLFSVYALANRRARICLSDAFARDLPLMDCFSEIMPISVESNKNWRVWIAFWARAHLNPAYLDERRRAAEESLELYREILRQRQGTGGGRCNGAELDMKARRLIAAVAGISLEACFAPDDWPSERMRAVLGSELSDLGF